MSALEYPSSTPRVPLEHPIAGLTTFEQVFAEPHGAADQLIDALVRACSASPTAGAETEAEPIERSKLLEWVSGAGGRL